MAVKQRAYELEECCSPNNACTELSSEIEKLKVNSKINGAEVQSICVFFLFVALWDLYFFHKTLKHLPRICSFISLLKLVVDLKKYKTFKKRFLWQPLLYFCIYC